MSTRKQILRLLLIIVLLFWLLPLGDLLGHKSDSPTILGRYSPSYVVLLAVYGLLALVIFSATSRRRTLPCACSYNPNSKHVFLTKFAYAIDSRVVFRQALGSLAMLHILHSGN